MPIDYKLLLNEGYNNIIASAESALSGISTMVTSRKELIFDLDISLEYSGDTFTLRYLNNSYSSDVGWIPGLQVSKMCDKIQDTLYNIGFYYEGERHTTRDITNITRPIPGTTLSGSTDILDTIGSYDNIRTLNSAISDIFTSDVEIIADYLRHVTELRGLTPYVDRINILIDKYACLFNHKGNNNLSLSSNLYEPVSDDGVHILINLLSSDRYIDKFRYADNILTLIVSMISDSTHREYFLSDIENMSRKVFINVMHRLCDVLFYGVNITSTTVTGVSQYTSMEIGSKSIIVRRILAYGMFNVYTDVIKSLPKSLKYFPYDNRICYVPTLHQYPKTLLQWELCNIRGMKCRYDNAVNSATEYNNHGDLMIEPVPTSADISKHTNDYRILLACPDKLLNLLYNNGPVKLHTLYTTCNGLLQYIQDGIELANAYAGITCNVDGVDYKMSPVCGSMMRQYRNARYNHKLDRNVFLDKKLEELRSTADVPMTCDIKLPCELETLRIKTQIEIITLGKLLGNCIGGKHKSNNLFFRKGSVCAEVKYTDGTIVQCYDAHNRVTPDCKEFRKYLQSKLESCNDIFTIKSKYFNKFNDMLSNTPTLTNNTSISESNNNISSAGYERIIYKVNLSCGDKKIYRNQSRCNLLFDSTNLTTTTTTTLPSGS